MVILLFIFVIVFSFNKTSMKTYHSALWSDDSSSSDDKYRYRTTHHKRTKQRGNEEQRVQASWTWEEKSEGQGPWRQAGEYRSPKEELEAAKAERRRYEARQRRDWRSQAIDLSQLPVLTRSSVVLVRHRVMRWVIPQGFCGKLFSVLCFCT